VHALLSFSHVPCENLGMQLLEFLEGIACIWNELLMSLSNLFNCYGNLVH
jgi:hypothetical protein